MALLIDGHNLIGAGVFEDIYLSDEDDEAKLVARLKVWKSRYRGKMTVVFDRGIPGGQDRRLSGAGVDVVFASDPAEADDLICRRLQKRPKDLTLVSNDARLIAVAASFGVSTVRGSEFVERFTFAAAEIEEHGTEKDIRLSEEEIDEWLELFKENPRPGPKSVNTRRLHPGQRK